MCVSMVHCCISFVNIQAEFLLLSDSLFLHFHVNKHLWVSDRRESLAGWTETVGRVPLPHFLSGAGGQQQPS